MPISTGMAVSRLRDGDAKIYAWHTNLSQLLLPAMAIQELLTQASLLPSEERRFLAEMIWETVDNDLPAKWDNESTISSEVERRFEAFKSGRERGLSHTDVFAAAKAILE
jgi:hypothetical protein